MRGIKHFPTIFLPKASLVSSLDFSSQQGQEGQVELLGPELTAAAALHVRQEGLVAAAALAGAGALLQDPGRLVEARDLDVVLPPELPRLLLGEAEEYGRDVGS